MQHREPLPEHDARHEFRDVTALAAELGVPDVLRPSRQEVVTGPGATVSVVRWARSGSTEPPRTVYLHGLGSVARTFDGTVLALGEDAVAVDLPGHGHSSWREDAVYSADTVAPAVLRALDRLAVPPAVFVGHSLGAIVAARIVASAPERVTGLVLVDMSPDFTQRAVDRIVRALEDEGPLEDLDAIADRHVALRVADDRAALRREAEHATVVRDDGTLERRHHFPHLPDGRTADVGLFVRAWADLEALRIPVLLVRGERGYVTPRLATDLAERLPGSSVVTVPGRHAVPTESPRALADAIRAWRAGGHAGRTSR